MKKTLCISFSMWILILYMGQIVLTDNLMYFGRLPYLPAAMIALAVGSLVNVYLLKSGIVQLSFQYHKYDMIFFLLLLTAVILDIGFADVSYDTYMYHIYLQENPFGTDKINVDFFPGRVMTSYIFALGDRCFYLFRRLLGFRLGTLLSYLILIPGFYSAKRLLRVFVPQMSDKALSLFAICPFCSFIVLYQLGGYLVDNFSIVLLLEIYTVVLEKGKQVMEDRNVLIYLALLTGLAIGVKYINAIFLIGLFLCVFIAGFHNLKYIKWHDYILCIFLAVLPMLPYLTDCWMQTGSPVFPYYNTIFQSPYYADANWQDSRYSSKTIIEFLVWPVYIIAKPLKANDFKNGLTDFSFAAGYVIVWIVMIRAVYRTLKTKKAFRTEHEAKMLFFVVILLYDFWAWEKYILGYVRFGGIILVLSTCLVIWWLYEGILQKRYWKIVMAGFSLTVSVAIGIFFFCAFGGPRYYASALIPQVASRLDEEQPVTKIRQAFTCIWKDRKNVTYDIDGIWGVIEDDTIAPTLLNVDDPIVRLEYGFTTGQSELIRSVYLNHVQGKNIYVPLYGKSAEAKRAALEKSGFEIKETAAMLQDVPFLQGDQTIEIVRVEYVQ